MKQIADWALNIANQRGAQYADARIVDDRQRSLATKNGKVGHASSGESLGIGIRVLMNESWGFASTDDLSRESVERTAVQALEIAKASATVKEHPIQLVPEPAAKIEWTSPCK
ncbi:MAG TPA: DNA gyrase modulator, partial [Candidatus Angelobacter sp.]|nr:DNA gyrase modulator [Candidatus Angelobacter sp.]